METQRLGDTDLYFSRLGLGTWAIGGSGWAYGWGAQEEHDSRRAILEALECGINWIDTAAVYGLGRSEIVVGSAAREWKGTVHIATKCGLTGTPDGRGIKQVLKRASVMKECEESLNRLQVESIDLYQIHWPLPPEDIEEAFDALLRLREQGKIRWAGVSNFSTEQLQKISPLGPVASLQPPYSILKREVEQTTLEWCAKNKCGVIAYSPMQCGILTGKFSRAWVAQLPADDWRRTKLDLLKPANIAPLESFVQALGAIARASGRSTAELAVAWVLRRREITAAIVGARKSGQIAEVAAAAERPLNEDELAAIEKAYARYRENAAA